MTEGSLHFLLMAEQAISSPDYIIKDENFDDSINYYLKVFEKVGCYFKITIHFLTTGSDIVKVEKLPLNELKSYLDFAKDHQLLLLEKGKIEDYL